jgi:hypothetical protein
LCLEEKLSAVPYPIERGVCLAVMHVCIASRTHTCGEQGKRKIEEERGETGPSRPTIVLIK